MEAILKEINAVVGVVGSFVCASDGKVLAHLMPAHFEMPALDLAARIASQTFAALEASGQRVQETDLAYDKGRLVLKNLRGGILVIVCGRNVNIPLLNLTANVSVKKLAAEMKPSPTSAPTPSTVKPPTHIPAPVALPPLVAALEQEAHRLVEAGQQQRLHLRVMNDLAIWLACPRQRGLLPPLDKRQIDFGGWATESEALETFFVQAGYTSDRRFKLFYNGRCLRFTDSKNETTIDIFLDYFEMYHRVDLTLFLTQEDCLLPVTALALVRLQLVEMSEARLRDLCALMLEHDLGVGEEKSKLDAAYITRLCADDWGWFKTISLNLERLTTFANAHLAAPDRAIVVERAQRLKHSIDSAPKSLRWQTRARLGESVKWHETPLVYRPGHVRPDMALG
jgi:predicted regulator of Ras-like GTPase activity (Roadblock/LC7/MglB family)